MTKGFKKGRKFIPTGNRGNKGVSEKDLNTSSGDIKVTKEYDFHLKGGIPLVFEAGVGYKKTTVNRDDILKQHKI